MRDPEITRQKILDVAASEIHARGFKATSLSDILSAAGISKGALYHHFTNKQELGYAVMEEIYMPMFSAPWKEACLHDDPIAVMSGLVKAFPEMLSEEELAIGCPLTNICTEMSAIDEGFRQRSEALYGKLVDEIATAITKSGLRADVDPYRSSIFVLASLNGIITVTKGIRCREVFKMLNTELAIYIEGLRTPESAKAAESRDVPKIPFTGCAMQMSDKTKNL